MSPNNTRLDGRTALVTGSTGGLGVAIAAALAADGAFVVVTGRDKHRGGPELRRLAEQATAAAGGSLDILVNNAAMLLMPTPTADISEDLLRDAFAVNVFAPFLLTGLIAPSMAQRGKGAVVNIGSITGLRGGDGSAVSCANKAAIHSLTQSWAAEFGPSGVRVNAVAPVLASEDAGNIHGAVLSVDGGWAAV
jgi:NAD(P)-dependent dehydrogenase (short-subunit alcohol dehydrogenase family)